MKQLTLLLEHGAHRTMRPVPVCEVIVAGWTGRDQAQVDAHIEELAALGVPRPTAVPTFYRVSADLLTIAEEIQVVGAESTGEVEAVLVSHDGRLWVGVGSDHTDRALEAVSVAAAKQACPKPLGRQVWAYDDIKDHWDRLILRSYVVSGSGRELYQQGVLAANRAADDLQRRYSGAARLPDKAVMFCGTMPVHGGFRCGERFEIELEDPVLGRSLQHGYRVTPLPSAA